MNAGGIGNIGTVHVYLHLEQPTSYNDERKKHIGKMKSRQDKGGRGAERVGGEP